MISSSKPPPNFLLGSLVGVSLTLLLLLLRSDFREESLVLRTVEGARVDAAEVTTSGFVDAAASAASPTAASSKRRAFVDCGANTASSVELFRSTYPGGDDIDIFSFEIDARLCPYFAGFLRHTLFCPVAVGTTDKPAVAHLEGPWSPSEPLRDGKEMRWGGGTLFASKLEIVSADGGPRGLSRHVNVSTIDLASWLKRTFTLEDEVILKLDVEGSEFSILHALLDSGAHLLVDKWYGELHEWAPGVAGADEWHALRRRLAENGVRILDWEADRWFYEDLEALNPPPLFSSASGQPGELLISCRRDATGRKAAALGVALGLSPLRAAKLVATLRAYFDQRREPLAPPRSVNETNGGDSNETAPLPVTLFLYSDFVDLYPDLVAEWARRFVIASRGEAPFPDSARVPPESRRKSLVASGRAFARHGIAPHLLLTDAWDVSPHLLKEARSRGLRVVRPTVTFPPLYRDSPHKLGDFYFQVRSVERTPKALRFIESELKADGGVVVLDADDEDAHRVSVFLLEFLRRPFKLVAVDDCF